MNLEGILMMEFDDGRYIEMEGILKPEQRCTEATAKTILPHFCLSLDFGHFILEKG